MWLLVLYQISYKIRDYVEEQLAKVAIVSCLVALIVTEMWNRNDRWPK